MAACCLVVLFGRLFQLQVVQGRSYVHRAENALLLRPEVIPFVRGSILDREGEVLVSDEVSWSICMDFEAIAACFGDWRGDFIRKMLRHFDLEVDTGELVGKARRAVQVRALEPYFESQLDAMWSSLLSFHPQGASVTRSDLEERARSIYRRVMRMHDVIEEANGYDITVLEETVGHELVPKLDTRRQIEARQVLSAFPYLTIRDATVRVVADDPVPFAHILGRMRDVQKEDLEDDPNAEDHLKCYKVDDRVGTGGIEHMMEQTLRGRRGQRRYDRDGQIIPLDTFEPVHGSDVYLTLHAGLQRRLYEMLQRTVDAHPVACGGAIVVVDVAERETLSLVSYPSFDPQQYRKQYNEWRDDTVNQPLLFRAVGSSYAPGSTVKPLVCLQGLLTGAVTPETTFNCTGYFLENNRESLRCWTISGTGRRMAHGSVNAVQALRGSCNIYMYNLGDRLGLDGLHDIFDRSGLGRNSGLSFAGESLGRNPDRSYYQDRPGLYFGPGVLRQLAIGQAQVSMTPVQVANLMALYADGRFGELTLIRGNDVREKTPLSESRRFFDIIRRGMYEVVNDPDGTAYKTARFVNPRWALCGKTGSASSDGKGIAYECEYIDAYGTNASVTMPATSLSEAKDFFRWAYPHARLENVRLAERYPGKPPAEGGKHSHAWFGGFLQHLDPAGNPVWQETPRWAFSVLVEFGGSGGRTTGPLAKEVAATLVEMFDGESPETDLTASELIGAGTSTATSAARRDVQDEARHFGWGG